MKILAFILVPLVAGLHRYMVSYSYRFTSRRVAFREGWRVAVMVAAIELIIFLISQASAECLLGPGGTGWRYRVDKFTNQRCWYPPGKAASKPPKAIIILPDIPPAERPTIPIPVPSPKPPEPSKPISEELAEAADHNEWLNKNRLLVQDQPAIIPIIIPVRSIPWWEIAWISSSTAIASWFILRDPIRKLAKVCGRFWDQIMVFIWSEQLYREIFSIRDLHYTLPQRDGDKTNVIWLQTRDKGNG